nr:uncharacterized protein LOC109181260 [Ipomoea batatas]
MVGTTSNTDDCVFDQNVDSTVEFGGVEDNSNQPVEPKAQAQVEANSLAEPEVQGAKLEAITHAAQVEVQFEAPLARNKVHITKNGVRICYGTPPSKKKQKQMKLKVETSVIPRPPIRKKYSTRSSTTSKST